MNERALSVLEFDKIRSALAERTSFSGGREKALLLTPTTSFAEAERWQQETAEAVRLLEAAGPPPFGGFRDIREAARRAALGAVLTPDLLLEVADTARGSGRLRAYLGEHAPAAGAEILADLGEMLGSFATLEREIVRAFDRDGGVADHASPKLAEIRARLRALRQKVREALDALVHSSRMQKFLQEPIVTLRGGRYVVPVKQEYRSEVPGVVHDQSASGATLFVEPLTSLETNNRIRQAEREEEEEIERILAELSALVAKHADELVHSVEIGAELDFIFAKGRLARDWDAVRPRLNREGWIDIRKGRHPLLTGDVVPIDVRLGREYAVLVITGPNTGGKTVTLKTVGLFSLMAQAGLHLPAADGTEAAVFRRIFADIGDEQSIEQSLSTFSSHMSHIVDILAEVDEASLVLLDELGAGTDPTEGAALAVALLERLIEAGCRTVATTHYSELKSFAFSHPAVENASVEFDVESLRPTFRLAIGVPGKSNAFAIASRLGLDQAVVDRARSLLTEEERSFDDLLQTVEADRLRAAKEREEAEKLRNRYEEISARYHEAFEKLKEARERVLAEAREEAQSLLASARREADALLGRLRKAGAQEVEEEAKAVRSGLDKRLQELTDGARRPEVSEGEGPRRELEGEPQPGMWVRIRGLGQEGEIVQALPDGKVVVQAGSLRVTLTPDEIEAAQSTPKQPARSAPSGALSAGRGGVAYRKASEIKTEIDLRGMLVHEALEAVDKYLDDATLAGLEKAYIIHGKGTGALRHAIQASLRVDPRVSSWRDGDPTEGGLGVTVVEL